MRWTTPDHEDSKIQKEKKETRFILLTVKLQNRLLHSCNIFQWLKLLCLKILWGLKFQPQISRNCFKHNQMETCKEKKPESKRSDSLASDPEVRPTHRTEFRVYWTPRALHVRNRSHFICISNNCLIMRKTVKALLLDEWTHYYPICCSQISRRRGVWVHLDETSLFLSTEIPL